MMWKAIFTAATVLSAFGADATPLDDYVSKPEAVYNYVDTNQTFKSLLGSTVYTLNVTSLEWLDASAVTGPYNSNVWSHTVVVLVPPEVKITNISVAYLTGNCNHDPKPPAPDDEELLSIDLACHNTGAIGVIVYQIPNCPLVYSSDPSKRGRGEDAMIAWTWKMYLEEKSRNEESQRQEDAGYGAEWLARLPMAKGAFQSMRSAQDFINNKLKIASVDGWVVSGASKRGWTTWAVGSATCTGENCVNVVGLAPLVPIAPDIRAVVHRQWQSYGGFTFAFKDYTDLNLTLHMDDPRMIDAMAIVDPINYPERLSRIPKFVVVSSDDEFMSMDWTNLWYDSFQKSFGETHLLIVQDSEHSLATGIPEVVESLSAAMESIGTGSPRPSFTYTRDEKTGELTVTIPKEHIDVIDEVVLRHSQTISTTRRDFRWVILSGPVGGPCEFPDIKLPKPVFGGNCIQPIVWLGTQLNATQPGTYSVMPPEPKDGHWTGYYVEVKFKSSLKADFLFTTPGFTWPDTLPFPPCKGAECVGRLL